MSKELKRRDNILKIMTVKEEETKSKQQSPQPFPDGPQKYHGDSVQVRVHTVRLSMFTRQVANPSYLTYIVIESVSRGHWHEFHQQYYEHQRQKEGVTRDKKTGTLTVPFGEDLVTNEPEPTLEHEGLIAYERGTGIETHALLTLQQSKYRSRGRPETVEGSHLRGITHYFHNGIYFSTTAYLERDYETTKKYFEAQGISTQDIDRKTSEGHETRLKERKARQLVQHLSEHNGWHRFHTIPKHHFIIEPFSLDEMVTRALDNARETYQIPPKIYEWILGKRE